MFGIDKQFIRIYVKEIKIEKFQQNFDTEISYQASNIRDAESDRGKSKKDVSFLFSCIELHKVCVEIMNIIDQN